MDLSPYLEVKRLKTNIRKILPTLMAVDFCCNICMLAIKILRNDLEIMNPSNFESTVQNGDDWCRFPLIISEHLVKMKSILDAVASIGINS